MGVVYGFNSPWASLEVANDEGRQLDAARATTFLQAQASWLRRGLERRDDPASVGIVLGAHDASHESWCALLATLRTLDETLANEVALLYSHHGRVVGSLERGLDQRLAPHVRREIWERLADRLTELTDAAVAALAAHAPTAGDRVADVPHSA